MVPRVVCHATPFITRLGAEVNLPKIVRAFKKDPSIVIIPNLERRHRTRTLNTSSRLGLPLPDHHALRLELTYALASDETMRLGTMMDGSGSGVGRRLHPKRARGDTLGQVVSFFFSFEGAIGTERSD